MPRPVKYRKVCHFPNVLEFLPADGTEKNTPIVLTVDEYNLSCPKDELSHTHPLSEQWVLFSQHYLPEGILKHSENGRLFCILLVSA